MAFRRRHLGDGVWAMVFQHWRFDAETAARGAGSAFVRVLKARLGLRNRTQPGSLSARCQSFAARKAGLRLAARFDFRLLIRLRPASEIRPANHRFRSRFDSSQARKTVRWGHFLGLEFAPVFAVKPGFVCARSSAAARLPESALLRFAGRFQAGFQSLSAKRFPPAASRSESVAFSLPY